MSTSTSTLQFRNPCCHALFPFPRWPTHARTLANNCRYNNMQAHFPTSPFHQHQTVVHAHAYLKLPIVGLLQFCLSFSSALAASQMSIVQSGAALSQKYFCDDFTLNSINDFSASVIIYAPKNMRCQYFFGATTKAPSEKRVPLHGIN